MRRGFTLIELLVVIVIILIVSVVALPVVLPAMRHRQVSEAARILQGGLVGARDSAIKNNRPSGIRLLPDPVFNGINPATGRFDQTQPLAFNRFTPIAPAPDYREGAIIPWQDVLPATVASLPYPGPGTPAVPSPVYGNVAPLMVYEAVTDPNGIPNSPTSWFWNIRVGDQIQINNAGPWYTVVGPMVIPAQGAKINGVFYANTELFVNTGPPGSASPFNWPIGSTLYPEFLLLVNGQDDNGNGWKDEGWDGVDNDSKNGVDDVGEWEVERWLGAIGGH